MSASKLARKLAEVERTPLARLVVSSSSSVGSATLVVEVAMASGPSSLKLTAAPMARLCVAVSPSPSVLVIVSESFPVSVMASSGLTAPPVGCLSATACVTVSTPASVTDSVNAVASNVPALSYLP